MLKYLFAFLLVFGVSPVFAQSFETEFESQFLWEVKQVNEFIERFNNNDSTLLKQYFKKQDPMKVPTREKLIIGLFNAQGKQWNLTEVKSFIAYANDKKNPQYLNFYGDNWCANVNCAVSWQGNPENVLLTLQLQRVQNGQGYKWVVTKAKAPFLKTIAENKPAGSLPFRMPLAIDSTVSLNPMSHATDFMRIDQLSNDKNNLANYFTDPEACDAQTQQFAQECISGRLKIKNAGNIAYNFTQIKGWDIEIQQYNRTGNNSGWLISKLTKTTSN